MNNDITELRGHLFATLRGIKDGSMQLETAQAINATAQTIINTAKVEVEHLKVTGGSGSGFIPEQPADQPMLTGGSKTVATQGGIKTVTQLAGGATITRHKMAG